MDAAVSKAMSVMKPRHGEILAWKVGGTASGVPRRVTRASAAGVQVDVWCKGDLGKRCTKPQLLPFRDSTMGVPQ